jgi:hypothetical protein
MGVSELLTHSKMIPKRLICIKKPNHTEEDMKHDGNVGRLRRLVPETSIWCMLEQMPELGVDIGGIDLTPSLWLSSSYASLFAAGAVPVVEGLD